LPKIAWVDDARVGKTFSASGLQRILTLDEMSTCMSFRKGLAFLPIQRSPNMVLPLKPSARLVGWSRSPALYNDLVVDVFRFVWAASGKNLPLEALDQME